MSAEVNVFAGDTCRGDIGLLYEPSSLIECLELFSRPLPRDHFLIRDLERVNTVSIQDVITGTGTERLSERTARSDFALKALPCFIDEISPQCVDTVGLPLLSKLLEIEPECDEDGVPVEQAEDSLCQIISAVLLRLQAALDGSMTLSDSLSRFLCHNEQLMYNKYKLLKSTRFAVSSLECALKAQAQPESKKTLALCSSSSSGSLMTVMNNFSSSVTSFTGITIRNTLRDKEGLFLTKVLVGELVTTQIEVCKASKDWSQAAAVIEQAIDLIDEDAEEDVVKALMRLLLIDERVLLAMTDNDENARRLKNFTTAISAHAKLDSAIKETVRYIDETIAEALG